LRDAPGYVVMGPLEVITEQDPAAAFLPIRASRAFSCGSAGSSDGIIVWSHPHR